MHPLQNPSSFHDISMRSCGPINGSTIRHTNSPLVYTGSAHRSCTRSTFADAQLLLAPLPPPLRGQAKSVGAFPATSAQTAPSHSRTQESQHIPARALQQLPVIVHVHDHVPTRTSFLFASGTACPNVGVHNSS
jgi:hypothetical protein